ncbi:MAG: hypothetical protein SFU98_10920 [Leptospiraceae bacterium]|nr:hypothetical protein [Leptospiraceae bacterium]
MWFLIVRVFNLATNTFKFFTAITLIVISLPLHSAEIILKNGDIYLVEIFEENSEQIKFTWKNENYKIPKSEILTIDSTQTGKDQYYLSSDVLLNDGSKLKAVITEEKKETLTLKSSLGYVTLPKSKIVKIESKKPEEISITKYKIFDINKKGTNIGFSFAYQTFPKINSDSSLSFVGGGNFFIEPQALVLHRFFRFGILGELVSSPNSRIESISLYNGVFYINGDFPITKWLHFYSNIGAGSSFVRYTKDDVTTSGINGIGQFTIGYAGFSFNRIIIRIGYKASYILEKQDGLFLQGGEFSIGYIL